MFDPLSIAPVTTVLPDSTASDPPDVAPAESTTSDPPDAGNLSVEGVEMVDIPQAVEMTPADAGPSAFDLSGLRTDAGQGVDYLFDAEGKVKGANVNVWRIYRATDTVDLFAAAIRWDDESAGYVWRDGAGVVQERGQHKTRLRSVVDQALREGWDEVLKDLISP